MPRNPFSQSNPQEPLRGENISQINSRKILRLVNEHGVTQEIVAEGRVSTPDGQGRFVVDEYVNYQTDNAGNPLPQDLRNTVISHSNLYTPSDKAEMCTSKFHPAGVSRCFYVGQDGQKTNSGGICSRCIAWHSLIKQLLFFIGTGAIIGMFIGIGVL